MPAPYSYKFRKKAIEAYKKGERKTDICRRLKISRNTLDLWLKREKQTGDFEAKADDQNGSSHKISDGDRFWKFAREAIKIKLK